MKRIFYPYLFIKVLIGEGKTNNKISYHLSNDIWGSAYNRITSEVYINIRYLYVVSPVEAGSDFFFKYLVYALNHEFMHYLLHKEQGEATTIAFDNLYRNGVTVDDIKNKIYGGV